ncbi:hypothetical protein M2128_001545 [Polynucleobacter sphagniphilus]|uniref:hypothetical protein n=1 Tax=Polynucleobacter sphagniphilus TaxID=1743169 RepID=UPI002473EF9F|nr:hypothetical protein [Polynucleobacter sphagniphilus]MDH6249553.1 hypothetical protein [Polynucleobacter sphagniphilus]MDH6302611.1 hypothetical protein [Polynucleobacter sphagniphilus]
MFVRKAKTRKEKALKQRAFNQAITTLEAVTDTNQEVETITTNGHTAKRCSIRKGR